MRSDDSQEIFLTVISEESVSSLTLTTLLSENVDIDIANL
jgi:hypothetical protein